MRPNHWTHDRVYFYKYMSCSTGLAVLKSKTLRWSSPKCFNDPFDIQFDLGLEFDEESLKRRILDQLWNAHYSNDPPKVGNLFGLIVSKYRDVFPRLSREEFDYEFGSAFEESLANIRRSLPQAQKDSRLLSSHLKVLCLSEVRDSILMWSHYAAQHSGLVLEFRCVESLDSVFGVASPVRYCTKMPPMFDEDFLVELSSGQASIDVRAIFERTVHSKAAEWSYEREWRLVGGQTGAEQDFEDVPFHPEELSSVILGCRISNADRREITDLVSRQFPHTRLMEAEKHTTEFGLIIRDTP